MIGLIFLVQEIVQEYFNYGRNLLLARALRDKEEYRTEVKFHMSHDILHCQLDIGKLD